MKIFATLVGIISWIHPFAATAQARDQAREDYALGWEVGSCLAKKCQVFQGRLLTESPKSGTLVSIRVDEALFGRGPGTDIVQVPYSSEILVKSISGSPGYPWRDVDVSGRSSLTVVLALEQIGPFKPGAPVRVISDSRKAEIIRSLTEHAKQFEASPGLISEAVSTLSSQNNPALAGYLLDVAERVTLKDAELGCSLFQNLVGNSNVPPEFWGQIVGDIVLEYSRLSGSGKGEAVRRFAELAQQSEPRAARAGFEGLARIAKFDTSVRMMVPPVAMDGLANAYRNLLQQGRIPRSQQLESQLGIKIQ